MHLLKVKSTLLGLGCSALLLAACQKQALTPEAPADNSPNLRPLTAAEQRTVGSSNDFAYQAFGALRQGAAAGDNVFISPLSISAALTMAYNGADGSTKAAMKQTLGFQPQTDQEINDSYKTLFSLLTGIDRTVTFTAANSIWYGQQYQLAAPFVQTNQNYFNATVQPLVFGAPAAAATINNWVAANTRDKITSIVDETTVDDVMYLVNAIYFKGSWTYQFDKALTRKADFHHEDGTSSSVDFMSLTKGRYRRYVDAQREVIDLPYGNKQYSMTIVLPTGQNTLGSVAQSLNGTQLASWLSRADSTRLELRMPKFKLEYEQELNEALDQLGMGVAFGSQADFSRMLANGSRNLAISKVQHKTYLDVNEEGTEAAAVTSVGIGVTSLPPMVLVNRPFIFLIREKSSNAILFIGQLHHPAS
jgi:serine protease inhibitor